MSLPTDPETTPNHHADHPAFSGVSGLVAALSMVRGREPVARLAADLTDLGAADHVVDVGCGPGAAAREAARRGARVTGVDPASVMLRTARWFTRPRAGRRIDWREGSAEALPIEDHAATVLWSLSAVHHWADVDRGLEEAARVLDSGGRLLATERRRDPHATGLASHGWTDDQAEAFADRCRATGFVDCTVATHDVGRGAVLSVLARLR